MKVSAERKSQNRAAILKAATRLLRERGADGIGVAEVMASAGLTHGGFYGHFGSREQLTAETVAQAMEQATELLREVASQHGLDAVIRGYLDEAHLADVAGGCPMAATASEIVRQPPAVQQAFAEGLRAFLEAGSAFGDRRETLARLSGMIGAMTLARAVSVADPALATELLDAARPTQSPAESA